MSETTLVLRPQVSMHQVATTPLIVALAIADALPHAAIGWPSDVVDAADGHLLSRIRSHAGYDGE